jgi:putative peptidoglycan lipid II flippase
VPALVLVKVLTPPFFAREDTRRPMIFAVSSVILTVLLGSVLFFWFGSRGWDGVLGLAIATSASAWVNVALLAGTLVREDTWRPSPAFMSRLSRILAASAVMAALLFAAGVAYPLLSDLFLAKEAAVLIVCGAGAAVYGAGLLVFRAVSLSELKGVLRREPGAGRASGLD